MLYTYNQLLGIEAELGLELLEIVTYGCGAVGHFLVVKVYTISSNSCMEFFFAHINA
jgi:hypothetical protein